jgi:hypothetical protein
MRVRSRVFAICTMIILFVGAPLALIQSMNVNLLHDPLNQVHTASVTGQPMTGITSGWYAQYPTKEGAFEIVCKSGKQVKTGYVTGYGGATLELGPNCAADVHH